MKKLHIGCGKNYFPGWINCDIKTKGIKVDVVVDVKNQLPFKTGTIDFIYSEHLLEHLKYADGKYFIFECNRVLKPGGVLRLSTPNIDYCIKRYFEIENGVKKCLFLNECFHGWGHHFLYNSAQLIEHLRINHFLTILHCGWRQSFHTKLMNLETRKDQNELIFEATK